jgi:hypothetical protein
VHGAWGTFRASRTLIVRNLSRAVCAFTCLPVSSIIGKATACGGRLWYNMQNTKALFEVPLDL